MNENVMYAEVYSILNILGKDYINKIPQDLLEYINNNRDKEYVAEFDRFKSIDEQGFMEKTIEFISFLNLEYWASDEERNKLTKIYQENDRKYEEKLKKEYNENMPEDIFKRTREAREKRIETIENQKKTNTIEENKQLMIADKNDSIFKKIINLFKQIIKK